MNAVHLIGVVQDNWFVAACGAEEHWDARPSNLRTVGTHENVTCKRCQRTRTYRNLAAGAKPTYPTHRRNMGERDHLKFGYDAMIEKRAIRERLTREGVAGMALHFAVEREYERAHKNDPTYREISAAFAARCKQTRAVNVFFTIPELLDIAERYVGANTEVGQAIEAKLKARFAADNSGSLPDRPETPVAADQSHRG